MTTTNATTTAGHLETETCNRCGGSGHYSSCAMYGTTCFKCGGRKVVYTKRGQAALEYLVALRSRRADSLKPGDVIRHASVFGSTAAYTVQSVSPMVSEGSMLVDGIMVPYRHENLSIELTSHKAGPLTMSGVPGGSMYEVVLPKDEQIANLAKAIAYQETLTKAGTVRKIGKTG